MCAKRAEICGSGEKYHGRESSSETNGGGEEMSGLEEWEEEEEEEEEEDEEEDMDEKMPNQMGGGHMRRTDAEMNVKTDGSEVEELGSETAGHDVEGDKMEVDGLDDSTAAAVAQLKHDHELTLSSTRSRRTTKQPELLHRNAFFDFVDDDTLPPDDDDDATRRKEEVESRRVKLANQKEEMEDSRELDFDPFMSNLATRRKGNEGDGRNGKIILPVLDGYDHIAAPMYCVYLMQSTATCNWYIGFTNRPWTRLREHNGHGRGGSGSNLGAYTRDPEKRPWRQLFLVEGFENSLAAQSFESTWQSRHPGIERDQKSTVEHFIRSLMLLLHEPKCARTLLDIRFFDNESLAAWHRRMPPGGRYRQAPLKIVDNVHIDVPGWDEDIKADCYKKHPLQAMKREVREYSLHHEHFLRGRQLITQSDTRHECTVCQEEIKDGNGRRRAIFELGANGHMTVTGSPLMVLCPSTGCHAISHMTCLADRFYNDERSDGRGEDYLDIALRVPISGDCNVCGETSDWKDYRRELLWRLKATHSMWEQIWRRESQNRKARRIAEGKQQKANRKVKTAGLPPPPPLMTPPVSPPRPSVSTNGTRVRHPDILEQSSIWHRREVTLAIRSAIFDQKITGAVSQLTWYEKILLGDIICTERFHEWVNFHIDNAAHVQHLPIEDSVFECGISMADVIRVFDASSVSWAHWETSRAIQTADAEANSEGNHDDRWRRPNHGKGIFKNNDTHWMTVDDERKRQNFDGMGLGAVTSRGTRPNPTVLIDKLEMKHAAEERRARMAEERAFRLVDKEERMKEDITERERQRALLVARKKLRWLQKICADVNPPPYIFAQLKKSRKALKKLERGEEARMCIMDQRIGVAHVREQWKLIDRGHAERRRQIRHELRRKRRYLLSSTEPVDSGLPRARVQRRMREARVRFMDSTEAVRGDHETTSSNHEQPGTANTPSRRRSSPSTTASSVVWSAKRGTAKRARSAERASLLTPPDTPKRGAKAGFIPPYSMPT